MPSIFLVKSGALNHKYFDDHPKQVNSVNKLKANSCHFSVMLIKKIRKIQKIFLSYMTSYMLVFENIVVMSTKKVTIKSA